jgi:hypothetical protein
MSYVTVPDPVSQALIDADIIPKECIGVEILLEADSIARVRYTILLLPEHMEKLARAFAQMAGKV